MTIMTAICRNKSLALLGLLATGLFVFLQMRSLAAQDHPEATPMNLLKISAESFKPDMVIGKYYVEGARDSDEAKVLLNQSKQIVTREDLPENTRIIPEGNCVTMDFVADRFNIHIKKEDNLIYKAKFG